jgi:predicted amidophosphoribosyltransferase
VIEEATVLAELIVPPKLAPGICPVCRGIIYEQAEICTNCLENSSALGVSCSPLIPVSLYSKPSLLRDWLTTYKSGDDHLAAPDAGAAIALIFQKFFEANRSRLSSVDPNTQYVVVVPSTIRPAPHPLELVLNAIPDLGTPVRAVLQRTIGPLGHNQPNKEAFEVNTDVSGHSIVLVDDVYTSGARAQSASYRLRAAGAQIRHLIALGRRINPEYHPRAAELLATQRSENYTFAEGSLWPSKPRTIPGR